MEIVLAKIAAFFQMLPFTGSSWFVICTLAFFVWLFVKANNNPNSPVRWEHLVIDSLNDRASPYKVGYLIGVVVSTWIVIHMSDNSGLTFDMFGVYLTFLVGGAGISSYANVKKTGMKATKDEAES